MKSQMEAGALLNSLYQCAIPLAYSQNGRVSGGRPQAIDMCCHSHVMINISEDMVEEGGEAAALSQITVCSKHHLHVATTI